MSHSAPPSPGVNTPPDSICQRVACPACLAPRGQRCVTYINGVDEGWTHDARAYADWGVRGA